GDGRPRLAELAWTLVRASHFDAGTKVPPTHFRIVRAARRKYGPDVPRERQQLRPRRPLRRYRSKLASTEWIHVPNDFAMSDQVRVDRLLEFGCRPPCRESVGNSGSTLPTERFAEQMADCPETNQNQPRTRQSDSP